MITSKQRAYLRKLANPIDTVFQIGKSGISDEMLESISNCLEARELIKLRVLNNSDYSPRGAADEISEKLKCEVVSVVGTKFVIYRESKENKKIIL